MTVLKRIATVLLAFPAAIVLVALAVTNRQPVRLSLDPFNIEPLVALELPFYVYLIGALAVGVFLGGVSVWLSQGQFRRTARARAEEAKRWRAEADRLTRERDAGVASRSRDLVPLGRRNAA